MNRMIYLLNKISYYAGSNPEPKKNVTEILPYAIPIILACLFFTIKTYLSISLYDKRKRNCTNEIHVTVENVETVKERMYRSEPKIWYVHTFSNQTVHGIKYYNRNGRCDQKIPIGTSVIIRVNPSDPSEFFFPAEVRPRKADGIVCGVMAVLLFLAILLLY